MVTKRKRTETKERKGRIKVGKLEATKELSAEEAKEVKGGRSKLLEAALKGKVFKEVEIHGTA